jgi:hypothetical protein
MDEVKKQLLTNKRLKEYFKAHPKEKEILQGQLSKNKEKDSVMYRHLDFLPYYALPNQILAITED